jgi:hypothetical protein
VGARLCWSRTRPAAELRSLSRLVGEARGAEMGREGRSSFAFLPPAGGRASARQRIPPTRERERNGGSEEEPTVGLVQPRVERSGREQGPTASGGT